MFVAEGHGDNQWDFARLTVGRHGARQAAEPRPLAVATLTPLPLILAAVLGNQPNVTAPPAPLGAQPVPPTATLAEPGLGFPWQAMALPLVLPGVLTAVVHTATCPGGTPFGHDGTAGSIVLTGSGMPTRFLNRMGLNGPTGITGTLASPDGDKQLQLRAAALVLPVRVDIEQPGQHHGQRTLVRSMTIGVWLDTWTAPTRRHEAGSERPTRRDEASWLLRNAVQSALTWSQQGPQPVATLPPWNSPWKTPMVLSLAVEAPARDHKGHHSPGTGQPAPQLTIAFPSPDWRLPGRPLVTERLVVPAGHHCDSRKHAPT